MEVTVVNRHNGDSRYVLYFVAMDGHYTLLEMPDVFSWHVAAPAELSLSHQ